MRRIIERVASSARSSAPFGGGNSLGSVVGNADRVVVVDTETTGVYNKDRVVEVAAVTVDLTGRIVDEWDTLVDPGRDVGPTWLHGITATMLRKAPTFADVVGPLAARLHGAVVAAHNLPFDSRMLDNEFRRIAIDVDLGRGFDTLALTGNRLDVACREHGVPIDGAHQALNDARATARLLVRLVKQLDEFASPVTFRSVVPPRAPDRRLPRDHRCANVVAPTSWLAGISATLRHDAADVDIVGYLDLLGLAMADLHLDEDERTQLRALARDLHLTEDQIGRAHRRWLDDFIRQASSDGVVDAEEYRQLSQAAAVLGIAQRYVDEQTARHRITVVDVVVGGGRRVCFTGEPVDRFGVPISRAELRDHARRLGMEPVDNVTKKRCDLLVAADPESRSGKAEQARRYGIPIVGAVAFLAARSGSSLPARRTTTSPPGS